MCSFRLKWSFRQPSLLLSIGLATSATVPAHANPLMFVASVKPPPALTAAASATSRCVTLTYDKNGNRLTQTVTPVTTATTNWGSASYGCFVWKL